MLELYASQSSKELHSSVMTRMAPQLSKMTTNRMMRLSSHADLKSKGSRSTSLLISLIQNFWLVLQPWCRSHLQPQLNQQRAHGRKTRRPHGQMRIGHPKQLISRSFTYLHHILLSRHRILASYQFNTTNTINTGLIQAYNTYYTKIFGACGELYNTLNTDNTYHTMKPLRGFV